MPQSAMKPIAQLVNLDLTRIALCNEGANTRANILLTKRKENTQMPNVTTFEEFEKAAEPEVLNIVKAHYDELLKAKDTELAKSADELKAAQDKIDELSKSKPTEGEQPDEQPEDIFKGLNPEVRALIEKQTQTINDLVARDQENIAKQRFELVKSIPCDEATLKRVLKTASPDVMTILQAAATAINENVIKDATGSDAAGVMKKTDGGQAAYDKLDTIAKSMAEEQNITYEAAFTEACMQNPDVYAEYAKGV